jgi:hypothetical protein
LCFFYFLFTVIGDPDEDCVSNKELRDMMKAMMELLTKNQVSATTTSPSTTSYCILQSLPSYDGFDSNKYFAWEIGMDKILDNVLYVRGENLEMLLVL